MNKIIIPTGYMGSGSSAITDLISEFEGYSAENGSFEYIFMHCPNGVFDLEDKLLIGNNAIRSDEAIHSFREMMEKLFYTKFWWPANYKKHLSPRFMEITNEYLEELIEFTPDTYWYVQEYPKFRVFIMMCFRKILRTITGNKVVLHKPLLYKRVEVSLPDKEKFYSVTRRYLARLFSEMGLDEGNLILDQLLLPFNLHRMGNYFDENVECFIIERDPRDMFISNKYVWDKMGEMVPYPTDAKVYCEFYKKLRAMEQKVENEHVHRIHFEDLVYKYDETVEQIQKILGLGPEDHVLKKKHFDPDKSIHNTQQFRKTEYAEEMKIIENELKDFLYDYPYVKEIDSSKSF